MKDRWAELCEQAISELDPHKFRAILRELNELLDAKVACVPAPANGVAEVRPAPGETAGA